MQQQQVKSRRERAKLQAPEVATAAAAASVGDCAFYGDDTEAERYTAVAKDTRVQHELAAECLSFLGAFLLSAASAAMVHGAQLAVDGGFWVG